MLHFLAAWGWTRIRVEAMLLGCLGPRMQLCGQFYRKLLRNSIDNFGNSSTSRFWANPLWNSDSSLNSGYAKICSMQNSSFWVQIRTTKNDISQTHDKINEKRHQPNTLFYAHFRFAHPAKSIRSFKLVFFLLNKRKNVISPKHPNQRKTTAA